MLFNHWLSKNQSANNEFMAYYNTFVEWTTVFSKDSIVLKNVTLTGDRLLYNYYLIFIQEKSTIKS